MGVSVSAAVAVIFIGFVVSASIFFAAFNHVTTTIIHATEKNYDDLFDRLHTNIAIANATYVWMTLTLTVKVVNTGSTTLDARKTNLLIDGELKTAMINWTYSNIDGTASNIWSSGTTFEIHVTQLLYPFGEHPESVKVVTGNCVSASTAQIYIPP